MKYIIGLMALIVFIRISFVFAVSDSTMYLNDSSTNSTLLSNKDVTLENIQLPIITYHRILDDKDLSTDFQLKVSQFNNDLLFIKSKGYTTISLEELSTFVDGKGKLPSKPIMITFDDGYTDNYTLAYPFLKKYTMKAVISIIGSSVGKTMALDNKTPIFPHFNWHEANQMYQSGLIEIINHSNMLHSNSNNDSQNRCGVLRLKNENIVDYKAMLKNDTNILQDQIYKQISYKNKAYSYPYGIYSVESEEILKECGINITLTSMEGMNTIAKGCSLSLLKRFTRTANKKPSDFLK